MTGIDSWSTTAATNATADGGSINWAEGQAPSTVNNTARQMCADIRSAFNDLVWFQYGTGDQGSGNLAVACVYSSGTAFTVAGVDVTTPFHAGRRVKAVGSGTGTIYGSISSSSFSTNTTVNVTWDSGSLSNETLTVYLSQVPVTGKPVAGNSIGGTVTALTVTTLTNTTANISGTATIGTMAATTATINGTGNFLISAIEFVIDGAGATITTGVKGYIEVPFACTINRATLLADQSGSIVVDVWKTTYSSFDGGSTHPVAGDKITASAPPTISSATKAQDSTLTGWTTSISAGDILAFNVNSVTTCQRVTISLKVTKT
jgi:hypothetical protein